MIAEDKKGPILLVDDDTFLLDMYSRKFREDGNEIETCLGGEVALERLRGGLIVQAVVLDAVMPDIDGLELVKTIKKEKLGGDPVIIMLSNQGEQADIEKAEALGIDGYIVKASAIPSEVLTQIKEIIKNKK
ncbi:MAG: response regulator [Candidatus Paceibacterota bacterium]